jgi:hypothetical protein
MVKSHTRKVRSSTKKSRNPSVGRGHMGLKKLRGSFDHMEKFVEHVSFFDRNTEAYRSVYERPLLDEAPSLDGAIKFIRSIV